MDRRTLLAIFAFVGVYYAYIFVLRPVLFTEPPVEVAETARTEAAPGEGTAPTVEPTTDDGMGSQDSSFSDTDTDAPGEAGEPAAATVADLTVPDRTLDFKACGASGIVDGRGGVLRSTHLDGWEGPYEVTAIYSYVLGLVTGDSGGAWRPYGEPPGPQGVASDRARFLSMGAGPLQAAPAGALLESTSDGLVMRSTSPEGIELVRTLHFKGGDPCLVDVEVTWSNPTSRAFEGPLWLGLHEHLPEAASAYAHVPKPYWSVDGSWNSYSFPTSGGYLGLYEALEEPTRYDGPVDWFGLSDGYFSTVLVPQTDGQHQGRLVLSPVPDEGEEDPLYGHQYVIDGLAPGASVTEHFDLYMGPNDHLALSAVHPTLYYMVDLGWFAFFGWPLLWLLEKFYWLTANWGLSIILLTVTVKLVFFPLTQMAYVSSQRMSALQPLLKELREKYADNQEELNKQTMALFRDNKVNPVGGCLPMLIQMPIWISLYRVLLTSVALYHTEFLYLKDLSVADPYAVLPVIVVGLMFAQQQMMPTGNMDPAQARIMKFMPLIFGMLFFSFPSGLVLYIFVNMLLTILQQWFIKRRFEAVNPASTAASAG